MLAWPSLPAKPAPAPAAEPRRAPAADLGGEEEAEEAEGVERRSHRRGLAPFSFVPWDRCASSPLNLPIEKMDYFLAG